MSKIELRDFLKYRFLSGVKLSAAGALYMVSQADLEKNGYCTNLYMKKALSGAGEDIQLTCSGEVKSFAWLTGETVIYTENEKATDEAPYGRTHVFTVKADGSERAEVCTLDGVMSIEGVLDDGRFVCSRTDNIAHQLALKGLEGEAYLAKCKELKEADETATVYDEYPFWSNGKGVTNKKRKALYVCTLEGGCERVTPFGLRTENVAVSGMQIVYSGMFVEPVETIRPGAYVYDATTGETACVQDEEVCRVYGVSLWNGNAVLITSEMDHYSCSQCPHIQVVDPKTGERWLLCDYKREINVGNPVGSDCRLGGGYVMRAEGDWLYFIMGVADASHIYRVNMQGDVECVFEKDGSVDCFDIRGGNIVMVAMHDMRLEELYSLAAGAKEATCCSDWNTAYQTENPQHPVEKLNFINNEGVEIHGFVIKPDGFEEGKKYPVILDIHGGPHLTYGAVYYHEMQYWASHGYMVIYCNPRGGDGRGNEFGFLHGRFGTIDFDDLMAFCDEVLEKYPEADASRMGVTGGSYGGFMTNWIIGHTDRFAAAASQRSISNFISMEGTSDIGTLFANIQIGGSTHGNVEKLWWHSPLKYADRCTTPTLFIHAEEDYRCCLVEAQQMYVALINHNVPTRLCVFHKENHELSRGGRPKGRIRRLEEITNWMDKYLKK